MDRVEAYKLLVEKMHALAEQIDREPETLNEDLVEHVAEGRNHQSYTIEIRIERSREGALALLGSIHDNNTNKFSLLEERLELDSRT
ncbi:hypothetical protein [Actibacterium ureilyticum]|uniref:hypothetical protein n=1 Tax=Actibacterium ureilyticum TaxID=1590614 RepID=UPI000BAAB361|nr:hypothetical protein [Actibacterium ureilyticum]